MKNNPNEQSQFNSVRKLAVEVQRLAQQAVRIYALEVEMLISEKVRDSKQIEHLLDRLLGFAFEPNALLLYKKLCRYYFEIDPGATAFYVYAYRDMWDEKNRGDATGTGERLMKRQIG